MRWLRRAGYALLALAAVGLPAYWWLLVESHRASAPRYAVDIDQVRQIADAQPGAKPQRIRVETVAQVVAPRGFVVAGDGLRTVALPVSTFELVYPDRQAIVDAALDAGVAESMRAPTFDRAAYARMSGALARAAWIVVTHEHPDHIGGLLAQPDLPRLLGAARLTREQVAEVRANRTTSQFAPLHLSPGVFDGYRPLVYDRYLAIAPGVVLIKAPGHTPGSQMVYVRRADGVEVLFVGDVAWHQRNIDTTREKARLVSWLSGEDRRAVREELAALHDLHVAHPELHLMPGHDASAIDAFVRDGLVTRGF